MPEIVAGTPEGGTPAPSPEPKPKVEPSPEPKPSPSPEPAPGIKSGDEDKRFKGIQADLIKERKQRQEVQNALAQLRQERELDRQRFAAAFGVKAPAAADPETDEIRQRFKQVIPPEYLAEMLGLSAEELTGIKETIAEARAMKETVKHYWRGHGKRMIDGAAKDIGKEYGVDLSERQKNRIAAAFLNELEASDELAERFEQGDPGLVEEFVKGWLEDWAEPIRKKATTTEVERFRRVPSGKDRSLVTQGEKKIDVTDDKAVSDLLVRGFKERGGEFGRR